MDKKECKLKIDKERCKGCLLCIEACPRKTLLVSDDVNGRGSKYVVLRDPEECTKCGLCIVMCPDCAIEIVEEE